MFMRHGNDRRGHRTAEYSCWARMISRCTNPKDSRYRFYGERGITVCDRWRESFQVFLEDMGPKPSPKHSIDRISNDLGYEPGNCRWATQREQMNNQRRNRRIVVNGVETTLAMACDAASMNRGTVWGRLQRGWTPERALGLE